MSNNSSQYVARLSHLPNDCEFLRKGTATSFDTCDICGRAVGTGETYYYYDVGTHDKPPVVGTECAYLLTPASYQRPYWMVAPNSGAMSNIRTLDDIGVREYEDGTIDEWNEIWADDATKIR